MFRSIRFLYGVAKSHSPELSIYFQLEREENKQNIRGFIKVL